MQPRDLLRAGRDAKQPTVHSAALAHCALGCNCFQHLSVFFFLPRVRWSKQRGAACNLRRRPLRYRLLRTVAASRGVQREQGGLGTGMGCYLPEKLFSSMHGRAKKCRPLPNAFLAHSCLAVSLRLDSRGRGPHAVQ